MTATTSIPPPPQPLRSGGAPLSLQVIALAGNPNSGKTTLFNALTGLRQKVANYPGVTVEKKLGRCRLPTSSGIPGEVGGTPPGEGLSPHRWLTVIDLPGTYSLVSRSPDEVVACEVLRGQRPDTPPPDAVIVVVDASNLSRNLYLVSQLIDLQIPLLIALSMSDVAARRGLNVSAPRLEQLLGVPVIPIVGHKSTGIPELKQRLHEAAQPKRPQWDWPAEMRSEITALASHLESLEPAPETHERRSSPSGPPAPHLECPPASPRPTRVMGVSPLFGVPAEAPDPNPTSPAFQTSPTTTSPDFSSDPYPTQCRMVAERLLVGDRTGPLSTLATAPHIRPLLEAAESRLHALHIDPLQSDIEARYRWIDALTKQVTAHPTPIPTPLGTSSARPASAGQSSAPSALPPQHSALPYYRPHRTDQIDRILIHRVYGLLIFAAVMSALFYSVFSLAQPLMDATQSAITWLGTLTTRHLPEGPLHDLINDGIFKGVGSVLVFIPQIAILFGFLAILEDSGYLARAAFLMDRLLAKVGLSGKAFIPLLSSFACAIPGIMATRTIESRKQRLATILIAPFMSCSARLPVFVLLIGTFFAQWGHLAQAAVMLACYALGVLAAAATAFAMTRIGAHEKTHGFVLELPTYKRPQLSQVARQIWQNTSKFVTRAGTVIFAISVVLWAMSYYPRLPETQQSAVEARFNAEIRENEPEAQRERDYLKAHQDNPADYQTQPGLYRIVVLTKEREEAVAAAQLNHSLSGRLGHLIEPVLRPLGFDWKIDIGLISAFAAREVFVSTMGIVYSAGDTEESTDGLKQAMLADRNAQGRPVWTLPVACSVLVWFVLALQCMSTLAVVRRETQSWTWPLAMLLYMNALAYAAAFVTYQLLTRLT